jgi:uncharacterized membrane protein
MEALLPSTIGGLPLHPLVVHATVVLVPLAALTVLLAAVLPRFRRWAGWLPLLLAAGALVVTPLATSTGENLEHQSAENALVQRHAELGGLLIWWVAPLFALALVAYVLARRRSERGSGTLGAGPAPRWLVVGLTVLGIVIPLGTLVQVVLIGHSGAQAVWSGSAGS